MKLPHLVVYTDNLPAHSAATAQAFVVRVKHKYKNDKALHEHEYTHVKQWYKVLFVWLLFTGLLVVGTYEHLGYALAPLVIAGVGVHGLLYLLIPRYRLEAEAEAYAAQVKPDRSDLNLMAYRLAHPMYKLGITQEQAKQKIKGWL